MSVPGLSLCVFQYVRCLFFSGAFYIRGRMIVYICFNTVLLLLMECFNTGLLLLAMSFNTVLLLLAVSFNTVLLSLFLNFSQFVLVFLRLSLIS